MTDPSTRISVTPPDPRHDFANIVKELNNRFRAVDRVSKYNSDEPLVAPTGLTLTFIVREQKTHLEWYAVVHCNASTPNACQADIEDYIFQIRPVKANGNPVDESKLEEFSNEEYRHHMTVTRKEAADMYRPHATLPIVNPRLWYYSARARIRDKANRLSDWTAWSAPELPAQQAEPKPPVPQNRLLNWDTSHQDRHRRVTAVASFDEVTNWDVPGGDKESDMAYYVVQLQKSPDGATNWSTVRTKIVLAKEDDDNNTRVYCRFEDVKVRFWYRFRCRSIDRFNRKGDWSNPTSPEVPVDDKIPAIPINVQGTEVVDGVKIDWDSPADARNAEIEDEDIASYQVQVDTSTSFNSPIKTVRATRHTNYRFETRHYKKRYWMRVRTITEGWGASAWVLVGPLRPQKTRAARRVVLGTPDPSQIDYDTGQVTLGGSLTNQAYMTGNADPFVAWVGGEDTDGDLYATITTGSVENRIFVGVCMRLIGTADYLYVTLLDTDANNRIELGKYQEGSRTTLATGGTGVVVPEQTYEVHVNLAGSVIKVYLDGVLVINSTLSSGNNDRFNQGNFGLFMRASANSEDNRQSRWSSISFTPAGASVPSIDDDFDRTASSSSLGTSDSGQTWQTSATLGGIEASDQPFTFYGYASTLPIFYMEDSAIRTNVNIPYSGQEPPEITRMGRGGKNVDPLILTIDRPTMIVAWGFSNIENESTAEWHARFYLVFKIDGAYRWGRRQNAITGASDSTYGRQRLLATSHAAWVSATSDNPKPIEFWWGYQHSDSAQNTRQATLRNQKMTILLSYAPDRAGVFTTTRRPLWIRSGTVRRAYRDFEGDDA